MIEATYKAYQWKKRLGFGRSILQTKTQNVTHSGQRDIHKEWLNAGWGQKHTIGWNKYPKFHLKTSMWKQKKAKKNITVRTVAKVRNNCIKGAQCTVFFGP